MVIIKKPLKYLISRMENTDHVFGVKPEDKNLTIDELSQKRDEEADIAEANAKKEQISKESNGPTIEEILKATEKNEELDQPFFIGPTRPRIEELTRTKILGSGNFSRIYLVEEYRTKRLFAMKEYSKKDAERRKKTQDLIMEKYVLNKLKGLKRVVYLDDTFKDDFNIYFNMEYLPGGELWEMIHCFGLPSKAEIKYYFYKLVLAVEEIHSRGIIHRDLKPENVMLSENKTDLKLIDFATSWDFENPSMKGSGNGSTGRRIYYHFVGTPQYMPMELVRNKGSYPQSDIYSLGCILYQLICGFVPYPGPGEYVIFKKTDEGKIDFYSFFTEQEKDLIINMTKKEYTDRISIQQIKEHPYFKDNLSFYESTSNSLEEVQSQRSLQDKWFVQIKDKVVIKFAELDKKAEKELKEKEELEKFKAVKHSEETIAEDKIEEPQHGEHPLNSEEAPPEVHKMEEKSKYLKDVIGEALNELPVEGEYNQELMKSKLKHLRKQLEHHGKLKQFEHYF